MRDIDLVFKMLGIFTGAQHKQALKDVMTSGTLLDKYGFLLFSPRILEPECASFSDIVLDIYQSFDMKTLNQEQTLAILTYLFSDNGIMSPIPNVKQLAA